MNKFIKDPSLEKTSDRFYLRDFANKIIRPTVIPAYSIDFLQKMRRLKYVFDYPNQVIINNHNEVAIAISTTKGLRKILKKIDLNGKKLIKEPKLVNLDIYSVNADFTQRLRFYIQKGIIISVRIITVNSKNVRFVKLGIDGREVPSRCEYILVERVDTESMDKILAEANRFFKRHKVFSYVVLKEVERFNFGKDTIWDHRRAVYRSDGGIYADATEKHAVLGMGHYIHINLQKNTIFDIGNTFEKDFFIRSINRFGLSDEPISAFVDEIGSLCKSDKLYRIELEYKRKFRREGLSVIEKLMSEFSKENISYSFDCSRKIKASN